MVNFDRSANFLTGSYSTKEPTNGKPLRNLTTTDAPVALTLRTLPIKG